MSFRPKVYAKTNGISRSKWLELRQAGIGGSDASAILGLNKWSSPYKVYFDKVIDPSELTDEGNQFTEAGNRLEPVVAKWFEDETGLKVKNRYAILQHPEHDFMLANVDRLIVGKKEGLECKTASEYLLKEWESDEVPLAYLIQCQHYMAVTGYERWWIAVLVGGNKFIYKCIERDEEIINMLIEEEKFFWENYVLTQTPPPIDGSQATSNLLKDRYPASRQDTEIVLPESEYKTYLDAIDAINEEMSELENRKRQYENQLKDAIMDNEKAIIGDRVITWKATKPRVTFKKNDLKKDHPDIFDQYVAPYFKEGNASRPFKIS